MVREKVRVRLPKRVLMHNGDIIKLRKWNGLLTHYSIYFNDVVYEAFPPRVRCVHWEDYQKWWLYRQSKVTIFSNPNLTDLQLLNMESYCFCNIGKKYNWLANYWFKLEGWTHCLEYLAGAQEHTFGVIYDVELSRVTPRIFEGVTFELGWK